MGSVGYRPSSQKTVTFSGIYSLVAGNSYTLRVRMRVPKWAGSNIYWNGSAMYFEPNGTTTHESYQGLFFKYRGTTGISPVGTTFTDATPIYIVGESSPTVISNGNWNWISGSGDICQTLNSAYRLPNNGEFGTESWTDWYNPDINRQGWVLEGGTNTNIVSNDDTGRFNLSGYHHVKNTVMGNVRLPASSQRGSDGSLANLMTYSGYYWCGNGTYLMDYDSYVFNTGITANSGCAFPVRCVVN
jgi:hypothetical protein